jgi:hypothetical protein
MRPLEHQGRLAGCGAMLDCDVPSPRRDAVRSVVGNSMAESLI